MKFLSFVET